MTLSELAVSIKGTRTTALRVLRNLSEKGLVSLSIEKMKPIRARIIQKGLDSLFSDSQIQSRGSQHIYQLPHQEFQVLQYLVLHRKANPGKTENYHC